MLTNGTARQSRKAVTTGCLAVVRQGALCVLSMSVSLVSATWAQSPGDLLWAADAANALSGGADTPGQVSGRPEVERPTSLAAACSPVVRLSAYSQIPIVFERGDETVARWTSDTVEGEYVAPLEEAGRWTMGFRHRRGRCVIEEHQRDLDYRLLLEGQERGVCAAYRGTEGWVIGLGLADREFRCGVSGDSVAEALRLSADTTRWPRLVVEEGEWTVGVSRVRRGVEWGVQYTGARPQGVLRVNRAGQRHESRLSLEKRRAEAYAVRSQGFEKWFLVATDSHTQGQGTVLMGLATRGDLRGYAHDCSVAIGWRRAKPEGASQIVVDWRHTRVSTRDQGHFGPLPGLLSPVYGFEGAGDVSTVSLRYGREWVLTEQWRLLTALSAHHAAVEGRYRLRKSVGIGSDPTTISERRVTDGAVKVLALSLGAGYRSRRWSCLLAVGGGYAWANRAISGIGEPQVAKGARFRPRPLLAIEAEYRF